MDRNAYGAVLIGHRPSEHQRRGRDQFRAQTAVTLGGLEGRGNLALQNASGGAVALNVGNNNADTTYSGVLSGPGTLVKIGTGTLTLTTPGTSSVAIVDLDNGIIAGGVVSLTSPTVMVGMPLTLSAAVADPFGQCQGVSFYIDVNGDGVLDSGDTFLGAGTDQNGIWSLTVSTTGWSPSTATGFTPSAVNVIAQATFAASSLQAPASTTAVANLNVTGDAEWAIVTSANYPNSSGYWETQSGDFTTVIDTSAYGGNYQLTTVATSGSQSAYATYTFRDLAPGNYEVWDQYVANASYPNGVRATVYDGGTSGTLLQSFLINETQPNTDNWPNWSLPNGGGSYPYPSGTTYTSGFGWSGATVYSNSGTITVKLDCSAANTEAPTIALIGDPESLTSNDPGTLGGPQVSQDSVEFADGGIQPSTTAVSATVSAIASPPPGAFYSNVVQTLSASLLGFGRNAGLAVLIGCGMLVQADNLTTCPTTQLEPQRNYEPLYGTKDSLTDNGNNLVLTEPDGVVYMFAEPATEGPYSTAPWLETIYPSGEVDWVKSTQLDSNLGFDVPMVVQHFNAPGGTTQRPCPTPSPTRRRFTSIIRLATRTPASAVRSPISIGTRLSTAWSTASRLRTPTTATATNTAPRATSST